MVDNPGAGVASKWALGLEKDRDLRRAMSNQMKLFEVPAKPRAQRQWRMHLIDAGDGGQKHPRFIAQFKCSRCGATSEWLVVENMAEGRRGIPCPTCNKDTLESRTST